MPLHPELIDRRVVRCRLLRRLVTVWLLTAGTLLTLAPTAWAQVFPANQPPRGGRGPGGMPVPGPRGGRGPTPTPPPKRPLEIDNKTLPSGYNVPPEPPKSMSTTEELRVEPWGDDRNARNKAIRDCIDILISGEFKKPEDKRLVEQVVEWYLAQMTLPKYRDKGIVPESDKDTPSQMRRDSGERSEDGRRVVYRYKDVFELRDQLEKWVRGYPERRNPKREARKYLMQMIAKHAPRLLDYHFTARTNAAILLANLSQIPVTEGDNIRTPPERFLEARPPLLKLMNDRQQDLAVRIWGVIGVTQIAMIPDVRSADRMEIVENLVQALPESAAEHWWYGWRIVDGLGQIGVAYDQSKRPIVAQALAQVLVDKQRRWGVRTAAAQSLGQLTYNSDVDLGLIAHEIVEMTRQMCDAYSADRNRSEWATNALRIYAAFKPLTEEEASRGAGLITIVNKGAAFAGQKKTVQDAFDAVRPVLEKLVKGRDPLPPDALSKLNDWLKNNPPKSNRIAESEPPIVSGPAAESRTTPTGVQSAPPS